MSNDAFDNFPEPIMNRSKRKTLQLFEQGLGVDAIARERGFSENTIASHLSDLVRLGHINVEKLVSKDDYKLVSDAVHKLNSIQKKELYEHLEKEIPYHIISYVLSDLARISVPPTIDPDPDSISDESLPWVLFCIALKRRFVQRMRAVDPAYPRFRLVVRKAEIYHQAKELGNRERAKALKLNGPSKYGKLKEYPKCGLPAFFQSKADAFSAAYDAKVCLGKNGFTVSLYGEYGNAPVYRVYLFRMKNEVWHRGKFKKANSLLIESGIDTAKTPAYYVGQTKKEINERYNEHIGVVEERKSAWGEYFHKPFEEAYTEELLTEFSRETLQETEGLHYGESIIIERDLTLWLREKGIGAYSA